MLKVDLLPRQFAIARTNKKLLGLILLILAGSVVGWFVYFGKIKTDITNVQAQLDEVKPGADEVRDLQGKAASKQSDLQPIQDKLQFIARADRSGAAFWDRFHSINDYIGEQAQVSQLSITPPSMVQFTVTVHGTVGAGRFVLNLLRCPALTNISISGIPAGKSVQGVGGTAGGGPVGPGFSGPGGPPGMPGMGGRADMTGRGGPPGSLGAFGGMPGAAPGFGQPPGMGTAAVSGVEPGSPDEPIVLQVTATLTESITIPQPPGAAPAMGMVGMFGPPGGIPGMPGGIPPMGGPGGVPGRPPEMPGGSPEEEI